MASLNQVTLMGNLGADPEIRSMGNGKEVANIRIATSESWKDKQTGEKREKTEWHNVVIFVDPLINLCRNYLHKGATILIQGELQTRKWQDKDGNDRWTTEVVLNPFKGKMVLVKTDKSKQGQSSNTQDEGYDNSGYQGGDKAFELDDEIPF